MPSIVGTTHYQARNKKARNKLLELLQSVTEYSRVYEPGVLRYLVCIPADQSDKTSVYVIENLASQEWSDAHYQSAPLQALGSAISSEKLLASTQKQSHLTPAYSFNRSGLTYPDGNTHIVVTSFGYHPGCTAYSVEGWKSLAAHCEANEAPALSMSVLENAETNTISTVQVFENAEYVRDVHLKSEALRQNQQHNGAYRNGVRSIMKLQVVPGSSFLGRG